MSAKNMPAQLAVSFERGALVAAELVEKGMGRHGRTTTLSLVDVRSAPRRAVANVSR